MPRAREGKTRLHLNALLPYRLILQVSIPLTPSWTEAHAISCEKRRGCLPFYRVAFPGFSHSSIPF